MQRRQQVLRAYCPNIYTVLQGQCLASNNFGIASETFILDVISPNHKVTGQKKIESYKNSDQKTAGCFSL